MRILITNDDGIHAPGLRILENIAKEFSDDVYIVAPESDQSGVSHALSLNDPLRMREISKRHFAIKGTPGDCVIMGVKYIMEGKAPDLILSGVNKGQNVAEDVTYSGTIAAAIEGTMLGIPSIALSQAFLRREVNLVDWECVKVHGAKIISKILEMEIPRGILINVNFPPVSPEDVTGIAVSAQGQRNQELLRVEKRLDGRSNPYYWLTFDRDSNNQNKETHKIGIAGTDLEAIMENKISITPLRLDLTDFPTLTYLNEQFEK